MSPLWSENNKKKLLTIIKKPSPTYQANLWESARIPGIIMDGSRKYSSRHLGSMEGISQFVSGTHAGPKLGGSMTVEAAVVLPLILFFFLNLGCAIEMMRLHCNLQVALWQTGRELAVYGYAVDSGEQPGDVETENSWWKQLGGFAVGVTYVKNRLIELTGTDYLEHSPLTNGGDGLLLGESRIFGSGDIMDIVVTYSVSPWSSLAAFPSFRMANRYYAHIWNGYQLSGDAEKSEAEQMVYVTASGTVYHLYRDCTHLQLSAKPVTKGEIEGLRNQNGGKYRPCEKCVTGSSKAGVLYITEEGDCYHADRQCSGLKRTIYTVKLSEVGTLRLCTRCGQRNG